MYALSDGTIVLSPSDLTSHLGCAHLTQLRLGELRGERARVQRSTSPHAELVRGRGDEHESEQLARLTTRAEGGVIDLTRDRERGPDGKPAWPPSRAWLEAGHAETVAAMRAGHRLIFQAQLFDGRWQGLADFLWRVDLAEATDERERELIARSKLGGYAYMVLDAKLAKEVRPYVVHQLAIYSQLIRGIQGVELEVARVVLGDAQEAAVRLPDYAALHRRVMRRFEAAVDAPTLASSVPEPVAHCAICSFSAHCQRELRAVDHLSFVARARRSHRSELVGAGVATLAALAGAPADLAVDGLASDQLTRLRDQAGLQLQSRATDRPTRTLLEPERAVGLAALPAPDPADLFFDLEGDPYVGTDGIEYLWGWSSVPGGVPLPTDADADADGRDGVAAAATAANAVGDPRSAGGTYACRWAHDEPGERAALEAFVDLVQARRWEHPRMHVYHYAPHERSKLLSLAMKYGTREAEVDQLMRDGTLVDLFAVVTRGVQVGEESYSLKRLERHHGFIREERTVREGGGSIVAYESWRSGVATVDDQLVALGEADRAALLESIRAYNEEDCRSTWSLRDWLWRELRPQGELAFGVDWEALREPEPEEARPEPQWAVELAALRDELLAGLGDDPAADDPDQAERRLLGELLLFHRRAQKPEWWDHFRLADVASEDLVEERSALGCLELDESAPVVPVKRSFDITLRCPPQEFKQPMGCEDPATGKTVNLVANEADLGRVVIRRGARPEAAPLPRSVIPADPIQQAVLRDALVALAEEIRAGGGRFAAARALLQRTPPPAEAGLLADESERVVPWPAGLTDALIRRTAGLDGDVLPVQGPPGTGKTFSAARMIVEALRRGQRVGVTAQSHAAIINLLRAVEDYQRELAERALAGFPPVAFAGIYKGDPDDFASDTGAIEVAADYARLEPAGSAAPLAEQDAAARAAGDLLPQLVAGTAWLFARESQREAFDLLFVDEAGQFALANGCVVATAARSLVLLGDPQQLPQVTQGSHPDGTDASTLEHLLAGHATVPPDRGVLLDTTWRMHPSICDWVSETSYDGRLRATPDCAARRIESPRAATLRGGISHQPDGTPLVTTIPTPLTGAGLRLIEVAHEGRSQSSPEEAAAIADACHALLADATITEPARNSPPELRDGADADGLVTRRLRPEDITVVAPYNLAVQAIQRVIPDGVRVGTVDKFQGQEAAVVFYALTCSSADDVPRGVDFLFDPNRLNVAVSRAQALAVVVHSPRLLDADCKTLRAMRRASGVCGLVEAAG